MESFRPTAPGAGAAGSCGCGTRCPALIGGNCLCGCACLLDSREARRLLAEHFEREREHEKKTKNRLSALAPPPKDEDAAAAAQALTTLSGPPRQQNQEEHAAASRAKKKGGCCGGGGGKAAGAPPPSTTAAAAAGGNDEVLQLESDEAHDAELEGIAAVVAAAVGAPLAGELVVDEVLPSVEEGLQREGQAHEKRKKGEARIVRPLARALGSRRILRSLAVPLPFFVPLLSLCPPLSLSLSYLSPKKQSSSPSTQGRASPSCRGALEAGGGSRGAPPEALSLPLPLPRPPPREPSATPTAAARRSGRPAPPSARRSWRGSPRELWSSGTPT